MRISPVNVSVDAPWNRFMPIVGLVPLDRLMGDFHAMPIRTLSGNPMPILGTPVDSTFEVWL